MKSALKKDGETYKAGDIFKQPLLADTYRRLATEGPESYYTGSIEREDRRGLGEERGHW